jgi:NADH dehydrogenase FAD-containing subunit
MAKTYEIVILGAHHAGVSAAHYVLRHVIPGLSKATPGTTYHVTIIAPHTEFYYNIPGPRVAVNDTIVPFNKVFFPIADAFKEYKSESYTFVLGKATAVDAKKQSVTVSLVDTKLEKVFNYSTLVIATGSKANSPLWFMNDSTDVLKNAYKDLHSSLDTAKTVLIAGGGTVGVETAGEIGYHLKKKITLVSGGARLLPRHVPGNSAAAESQLKKLGVEIVHNVRTISSSKTTAGKTEVKLNDGTSRIVDVYIDATGPTPNSSFLPAAWLDLTGRVLVDDKTFRVKGAPNVYAGGDIASCSDGGVMAILWGTAALGSSIGIDIAKEMGVTSPVTQKEYSPLKDTQFVTIGPKGGVAQLKGWRVPSLMVWAAKSRTMMVEKAEGSVKGVNVMKP